VTFNKFDLVKEVIRRFCFGPFFFEIVADPKRHPRLARRLYGPKAVVMLDYDTYDSIVESIDILSDDETMASLAEAEKELGIV
jgi:hypothetical protein